MNKALLLSTALSTGPMQMTEPPQNQNYYYQPSIGAPTLYYDTRGEKIEIPTNVRELKLQHIDTPRTQQAQLPHTATR